MDVVRAEALGPGGPGPSGSPDGPDGTAGPDSTGGTDPGRVRPVVGRIGSLHPGEHAEPPVDVVDAS